MSWWRRPRHAMRRRGTRIRPSRLRPRLVGLVLAIVAAPLLAGGAWLLSSAYGPFVRVVLVICPLLLLAVACGIFMLLTGVSPDDLLVPKQRLLFRADRLRRVALSILLVVVFVAVLIAFVWLAVAARAP